MELAQKHLQKANKIDKRSMMFTHRFASSALILRSLDPFYHINDVSILYILKVSSSIGSSWFGSWSTRRK
jgi:hypothetical protein